MIEHEKISCTMLTIRIEERNFLRSFASGTKNARIFWGLSREELAKRAGVHVNTVGMMERGDRDSNSQM